jgi:hypothetical protein
MDYGYKVGQNIIHLEIFKKYNAANARIITLKKNEPTEIRAFAANKKVKK